MAEGNSHSSQTRIIREFIKSYPDALNTNKMSVATFPKSLNVPAQPVAAHKQRKPTATTTTNNLLTRISRENLSPVPIINEVSEQSHSTDFTGNQRPIAKLSQQDAIRRTFGYGYAEATIAPKDAGTSTRFTNLKMHTPYNQMKYEDKELACISHKNQLLVLERERLLTTIQNTSAMLQSTVNILSKDHNLLRPSPYETNVPLSENSAHCFQIEPNKSKKSAEESDYLERSTRCTIIEFDNLLNALQKKEQSPTKGCNTDILSHQSQIAANMSQYDVIVNWLNNKSEHSTLSSSTSPSLDLPSLSASTRTKSSKCDSKAINKLLHQVKPSSSNSDDKLDEDSKKPQLHSLNPTLHIHEVNSTSIKRQSLNDKFKASTLVHDSEPPKSAILVKTSSNPKMESKANLQEQKGTINRREDPALILGHDTNSIIGDELADNIEEKRGGQALDTRQSGENQSAMAAAETAVAHSEDKQELLQSWLQDLKIQTHQYLKSHGTPSHLQEKLMKSKDDHEEFIALCRKMTNRMDSVITKTSQEHILHGHNSSPSCSRLSTSQNLDLLNVTNRNYGEAHHKDNEGSSPSSSFTWTDVSKVEKDRNGLNTLQKCLANLEEVNMRRTNNALTQTLIIKALRKLMARQCCQMTRNQETDVVKETVTSTVTESNEGFEGELESIRNGVFKTEKLKLNKQIAERNLLKSEVSKQIGDHQEVNEGKPSR